MKYSKYRFAEIVFKHKKTGNEFTASIDENDRFYHHFEQFLDKEKADAMIPVPVDSLYVYKTNIDDICGKTYQMKARVLLRKKPEDEELTPKMVTIDEVCIEDIDPLKVDYNNKYTKINSCNLTIQWQSRIKWELVEE